MFVDKGVFISYSLNKIIISVANEDFIQYLCPFFI